MDPYFLINLTHVVSLGGRSSILKQCNKTDLHYNAIIINYADFEKSMHKIR